MLNPGCRSTDQGGYIYRAPPAAQLDRHARALSRGAAKRRTLRDLLTHLDAKRAEAGHQAGPAVAMIDHDDGAIAAKRPGKGDLAARGRNRQRLRTRRDR